MQSKNSLKTMFAIRIFMSCACIKMRHSNTTNSHHNHFNSHFLGVLKSVIPNLFALCTQIIWNVHAPFQHCLTQKMHSK